MHRLALVFLLVFLAGAASAQQVRELTFFSGAGFGGERFTVTGPRANLDMTFAPRSVRVLGGGSWISCASPNYAGACVTIAGDDANIRLPGGRVESIRPTGMVQAQWLEIVRLNVRDRAERDTAAVRDSGLYSEVMVCAERNAVRVRRAEIQLDDGGWQRLFLPLVLSTGECSKGIDLLGRGRRVRAVQFEYEAWSPGIARGTIVVRARPYAERDPR